PGMLGGNLPSTGPTGLTTACLTRRPCLPSMTFPMRWGPGFRSLPPDVGWRRTPWSAIRSDGDLFHGICFPPALSDDPLPLFPVRFPATACAGAPGWLSAILGSARRAHTAFDRHLDQGFRRRLGRTFQLEYREPAHGRRRRDHQRDRNHRNP